MPDIVVKDILDAGVHYGHKTSRWNPKMRPYIYGRRNLIHIIDIKEDRPRVVAGEKVFDEGFLAEQLDFVCAEPNAKPPTRLKKPPNSAGCLTSPNVGWAAR